MKLKTGIVNFYENFRAFILVWFAPVKVKKHEVGLFRSSSLFSIGFILVIIAGTIGLFSCKIASWPYCPEHIQLPFWLSWFMIIAGIVGFPMIVIGYLLYKDDVSHYDANTDE